MIKIDEFLKPYTRAEVIKHENLLRMACNIQGIQTDAVTRTYMIISSDRITDVGEEFSVKDATAIQTHVETILAPEIKAMQEAYAAQQKQK